MAGPADPGGGQSIDEPEPAYQQGVQNSGFREMPDVALVADPQTGVATYDSYNNGSATPWDTIGGTSLAGLGWPDFDRQSGPGTRRLRQPHRL